MTVVPHRMEPVMAADASAASAGDRALRPGLYERLLDAELSAAVRALTEDPGTGHHLPRVEAVDDAEAPHVLARHLGQRVERALYEAGAAERVQLVNALLALLPDHEDGEDLADENAKAAMLRGIPDAHGDIPVAPSTPLSDVALLTNADGGPQLGSELRLEMASAQRVDLLCSFVKSSGMRLFDRSFADLRRRGVPFRILTTTYTGATDRKALDDLVRKYGAEVRVNYDSSATRLHAKAWLFHRDSGFDTGYVGSSNLSRSAQVEGMEWNVRISQVGTPTLVERFESIFASYWESENFEPYDPDRDAERLDRALGDNRNQGRDAPELALYLDVRPYPHQQKMLDDLEAEREVHGRHRNLLVAATGTGKTVIAALDYHELFQKSRHKPRLLFLAHRQEILEHARLTYRAVLHDGVFGELFVDGNRPRDREHVFASVQGLSREEELLTWAPDSFDVIVIDEFHHAQAQTYRRIIDHFQPRELLGLTATPERADGTNVAQQFFEGRTASELRLWDALDADLLVPFHYFGIADQVDLSRLHFSRGSYRAQELSEVYTGHHARFAIIYQNLVDKIAEPLGMRALGFCVSVEHAQFMAQAMNDSGIPSIALTGSSTSAQRHEGLAQLREGSLNCIFAVDLFNEGLDIPEIDTVLMLRPTQSATIFLQQLGRGLRRAPGKSVLTVLDFVGHQHREFRFDLKLRALTGQSRHKLRRDVERGFPFLPSGSQIILDREVEQEVLENIRRTLNLSTKELVSDIRTHKPQDIEPADYRLGEYLRDADRGMSDIYGATASRSFQKQALPASWNVLKRWAWPQEEWEGIDEESELLRRVRSLLHVNDPERITAYRRLLTGPLDLSAVEQDSYAWMLYFSMWPQGFKDGFIAGLMELRTSRWVVDELNQVLAHAADDIKAVTLPLGGQLAGTPLRSHARYSREELLAALGQGQNGSQPPGAVREGVKWLPEMQTDALLVTLQKSETDYSPTTMYHDYAVNPHRFHWESQSNTSAESPTGRRYVNHAEQGSQVVLFVREAKTGDLGTMPYTCLGTVTHATHRGSKPMQIEWELARPMPQDVYRQARAVA